MSTAEVEKVDGERGTWRVRSRSSGKRYWIEVGAERIRCDCPDFRIRREKDGGHCKHIVQLAQSLGFEVLRCIQEQEKRRFRAAACLDAVDTRS